MKTEGAATVRTVKDPIRGMDVVPEDAAGMTRVGDAVHYFCSTSCKQRFDGDPQKYLGERRQVDDGPADATFTCPMHPEVRQDGPGSCPKCGMALGPRTVTAEEDNPELRDMTRRFWVSTALTVPLVVFAMVRHVPAIQHRLHDVLPWAPWLELAVAAPVVLWGG